MEIVVLMTSFAYHRTTGNDKPLYEYEKIIFDSLITQNGNIHSSNNNHLWIKKATGLCISEFILRFMAGFASNITHCQVLKCVL